MATLSKRKGKRGTTYYLNWYDNGQRHRESLGCISDKEARAYLRSKENELDGFGRTFTGAPLFCDLAESYAVWRTSEYPDSQERIKQIIEQHLEPAFKYTPIDQLRPLQIERYKAERLAKVKAATVSKEIRTLKAMLRWAVTMQIIEASPIQGVKPPPDVTSKAIHWYEMDELQEIYENAKHPAIWQFMANTGIRRGEVDKFRDRGEYIVIESQPGARTKSGKHREVPLSRNARAALDALGGAIPLTGPNLSRAFRLDLPEGLGGSLHSLRHTFGTQQAIKGTQIHVLKELMGHSRITVTEKYLHVADQQRRAAIEGFEI